MEFLREIFGDKALTYDELAAALKDSKTIKIGNLAGGAYVGKEKFDTERLRADGLQAQLNTANETIQTYKDMDIDGIKQSVKDWETKYDADTQALQTQLNEANYGFAVKEAVSGLKFTSESARKAFISDLTAKKLPLQDGKLLGLEDYTKEYKEADPGAFAEDTGGKTPIFVRGGSGGIAATADAALRAAFGLSNEKE